MLLNHRFEKLEIGSDEISLFLFLVSKRAIQFGKKTNDNNNNNDNKLFKNKHGIGIDLLTFGIGLVAMGIKIYVFQVLNIHTYDT